MNAKIAQNVKVGTALMGNAHYTLNLIANRAALTVLERHALMIRAASLDSVSTKSAKI